MRDLRTCCVVTRYFGERFWVPADLFVPYTAATQALAAADGVCCSGNAAGCEGGLSVPYSLYEQIQRLVTANTGGKAILAGLERTFSP